MHSLTDRPHRDLFDLIPDRAFYYMLLMTLVYVLAHVIVFVMNGGIDAAV